MSFFGEKYTRPECKVEGCINPSKEDGYCRHHFEEKGVKEVEDNIQESYR